MKPSKPPDKVDSLEESPRKGEPTSLGRKLLLGGCLCYQATTLLTIIIVFLYFAIIGPENVARHLSENTTLLVKVAIPTTSVGILSFVFCYYVDRRY